MRFAYILPFVVACMAASFPAGAGETPPPRKRREKRQRESDHDRDQGGEQTVLQQRGPTIVERDSPDHSRYLAHEHCPRPPWQRRYGDATRFLAIRHRPRG